MRIAIDAFGGDNAPDEVIKGAADAIAAYKDRNIEVILTGDEAKINERINALGVSRSGISIEPANGVIRIEDNPQDIRKAKADCSMGRAFRLVNEGKADAFVSAGSTAAIVVGGTVVVGRLKGVKRPSLVPIMPSISGQYLLLDGGANLECRPEMLLQFGIMGSIYMKELMGVEKPRVGLLNIGAEEEKGRELEHGAYELLSKSGLNFVGNVEARDVPLGAVDVIVTDGFTGNIYLKAVEGMGKFMKRALKETIFGGGLSKVGALFAMGGIKKISKQMDYREVGGSPLLGSAKPVIKAHGSSDALAFMNAIRQANDFAVQDVNGKIAEALAAFAAANKGET
ncbi:MAG: phosphate acyltransferase PlsX [Ruminiclostridium sp.]|nr:phosphate acyltransferase PlsX [Ruminiclostridium sp.]